MPSSEETRLSGAPGGKEGGKGRRVRERGQGKGGKGKGQGKARTMASRWARPGEGCARVSKGQEDRERYTHPKVVRNLKFREITENQKTS